ncbi:Xylose isomerase domain-containing protein TIM barrel [Acidobacteriia bacterium SbA2]|nr:Xylose isomerase domain-containing protein TIM barrel [Acidobacteriia bacterium SbA2]
MIRRDFFTRLAVGAGAFAFGGDLLGQTKHRPAGVNRPDKRSRISISTWSLHNYFQSTREKEFTLPGDMLSLIEFPEMIADRYQVHNLEFCAPHFASTEKTYLQEVKGRLVRAHSRVVNMPVDIDELWRGGGLSDTEQSVRDAAVNASKIWIDVAQAIGSKSVRCDPGKFNPQDLSPTLESYRRLAAYGKPKGVHVIIENHGGVGSEHPEELVKLFEQAGPDVVGALPDFGNFPDEATRETGLPILFPYAHVVCHAKGLEFDSAGNETKYDFPKCIEISKKAAFAGVYSIEFEGPGDPYEGVKKTLDELLKYL